MSHNKDVYVIGGGSFEGPAPIKDINRVSKYNTESSGWEIMTVPGHERITREGVSAFIICNRMYVIGKWNEWIYELVLRKAGSDWQRLNTRLPFVIENNNPVVINGTAYIFGGLRVGKPDYKERISVISWSPGHSHWKSLRDMNNQRFGHCKVTDSLDRVWVLGGCELKECEEKGFIEEYRISSNTWTQLNGAPEVYKKYPEINVCVYWRNFIYVSFCNWRNKVDINYVDPRFHVFNILERQWEVSKTPFKSDAARVIAAIVPKNE